MAVLPNELFIKIVEEASKLPDTSLPPSLHAFSDDVWTSVDRPTLRSLSLVSRLFRDVAQPLLFQTVAFTKPRDDGTKDTDTLARLRVLIESPLSEHVRYVGVAASAYSEMGDEELRELMMAFIRRVGGNIRTLSFADHRNPESLDGVERFLCMQRLLDDFAPIFGGVDMPNLRSFRFAGVSPHSLWNLFHFAACDEVEFKRKIGFNAAKTFLRDIYLRNMSRITEQVVSNLLYLQLHHDKKEQQAAVTTVAPLQARLLQGMLSGGKLRVLKWDIMTSDPMRVPFDEFTGSLTTLHLSRTTLFASLCGAITHNPGLRDVDLRVVHLWDAELLAPWNTVFAEIRALKGLKKLFLHELGYGSMFSVDATYLAGLHTSEHCKTLRTGHAPDVGELVKFWEPEWVAEVEMYPRIWEDVRLSQWGTTTTSSSE